MRLARWALVLGMAMLVAEVSAADTQPVAGSVSGSVALKDGKAAGGAVIQVLLYAADRSHDPVQVKTQTADADGKFKIEGLEPGSYLLKFESAGQMGNKSATVRPGKDSAIGKVTLKAPNNTGRKVEPKEGGGKAG